LYTIKSTAELDCVNKKNGTSAKQEDTIEISLNLRVVSASDD